MPGFLDYYRQFEEMPPEEVSRELRERRDEEKARMLAEVPPLDLASPAWHEPPHPEIVNAATFALRRAVNAYPDASAAPLRELLAARHGTEPAAVAAGHGAGALLRAACQALLAGGGEVAVAWPGWGPLPRLVQEAGGEPMPVALAPGGGADVDALLAAAGPRTRAVALCSPNDPTGGTVSADGLRRLAEGLPKGTWILLDAALAEFADPADDLTALAGELDRLLVVRSFSKAHAMAGFRAGYAVGPAAEAELLARLSPPQGVSAPAQAGMAWAAENGERYLPRRRAAAARERERLAAALAGSALAFPAGAGPLAWLSSDDHDGPALAAHLASRRIFVTPGTAWGDDRHVRVTLRDGAATDRLVAALDELSA
jgi:histidinol-phosphate/aromatic aminotransferase/cobyric acid decarboxylase-like protein